MQGLKVCRMVSRVGRLGLAACLLLSVAQSANAAALLNFSIQRTDDQGNTTGTWGTRLETTDANPVLPYSHIVDNDNWDFRWTGMGDSDPIVTSNFVVTNNTAFTQTYSVTVLNAVLPPIPGATITGGSITGTVTDGNGDTATVASAGPGTAVYTSIIDNVDFVKLLNHPFSQSTAVGDPFGGATIGPAAFGQPIPSMPGPPALINIGIRLNFTLTAFDSASFTSNFVVVPEPAGLTLLGLAATGLLARRRRAA